MRYLIGTGNYTGFDDSIGLRVAETIAEDGVDHGFRVIDLGGNLLDLVHYLDSGTDTVLIVDCARMGMEPGEYLLFAPDQVKTRKELGGVSTHEADLLRVLDLAASLGRELPTVTILGIEPEEIRAEVGLSATLANRMGEYVRAALDFFASAVPASDSDA